MMRVISGIFRSRQLKGKPPVGIRPTSDKLRETVFNVVGSAVAGSMFLDGFAGIGGVGIEALSRGARLVYFVDQSRKACAIIRENLESLGVKDGTRIIQAELGKALDLCEREGIVFDIVFLDPPYEQESLYAESLVAFGSRSLLAEQGLLILEHSKRVQLAECSGRLRRYRLLTQGDSALSFYRIEQT
jgi:16S rRNA (guanine(966)-N(2))-methyltransferase RsmD